MSLDEVIFHIHIEDNNCMNDQINLAHKFAIEKNLIETQLAGIFHRCKGKKKYKRRKLE